MILLDFSGTIFSCIMGNLFHNDENVLDEEAIRKSILNQIRKYNQKFKKTYGPLVICCDGKNCWRKDIFPYYKCKRRETQAASQFNFVEIFHYIDKIKEELKDYFYFIEVEGAEADDVIAAIIMRDNLQFNHGNMLVISRDKDLKQLQKFDGVFQYNPIDDGGRFEVCNNPSDFLLEHIIIGDNVDSIPNIFSDANSFALHKRQKPATRKRIDAIKEARDNIPSELKERFELNQKLICLEFIPGNLIASILEQFDIDINKKRKNLLSYFARYSLMDLAANIRDFN